ncbi:glycosyltransferase family 4 protein [Yinghuangia sp. ASG 101]|uniref:glycosyltransferase family 4 protein n=1 Tax=Yinghuangia sp. ASG 101 TaxID=2896848 RepID=UPI001E443751|nr:glycosyltransferase family 4 protein [Yinghuangia sp. ASG 101]UGQ09781.1 glycosyltransferase family 4 protein [Yinghuangia sp. ASG 101]
MRIAVVNNFFPPRVGGSSHLSAALAREYAARGHEVVVLTTAYRGAPAYEIAGGIRIHRLPAFTMPKLGLSIDFDITFASGRRNQRRVSRILDAFRPDVIHQHGQFLDLTWLTGRYARRRRVPVLLSVHTRLESPRAVYAKAFSAIDRVFLRRVLRGYAPRFVIMDELMETYCADRYEVAPDRFDHIPVAVDTTRFDALPTRDIRAELGLGDGPLIASVGHVIPLRDRRLLIDALPAVRDKYPDAKLVIVGTVYYDAFLERARELGVGDAVVCVGEVPAQDVPAYFAAADIEVHDLSGGGCGTASLEAIAAGCPTVVAVRETNFPGIRLRNWENSVLVSHRDPDELARALIRLLDDPDERAAIAGRQRELVREHFTLDRVTEQHLEVFAGMLGRPPGPAPASPSAEGTADVP